MSDPGSEPPIYNNILTDLYDITYYVYVYSNSLYVQTDHRPSLKFALVKIKVVGKTMLSIHNWFKNYKITFILSKDRVVVVLLTIYFAENTLGN